MVYDYDGYQGLGQYPIGNSTGTAVTPTVLDEEKLKMINFLNQQNDTGNLALNQESSLGSLVEILEFFRQEYNNEQERVSILQNYISSQDNVATPEEQALVSDITETLFSEFNLSQENKDLLANITGRERVGLGALVWLGIGGGLQAGSQITGTSTANVDAIFSRFARDPISMLAMGNIIYKAVKDFEDGATTSEVFAFLAEGSISAFCGARFIDSFIQAKKLSLTNGTSFLDSLKDVYIDSNVLNQQYKYSYIFDTATGTLASTRFVSSNISDIIATSSVPGTLNTLDGIAGTYRPIGSGLGNIDAPKIPNQGLTPDVSGSGTGGKVLGALGIGADLAWVASALNDVIVAGRSVKPSQIMNLVGAVVATTGDIIGMVGGPLGQAAGMIVSALGSIVTAAGGLADLNSDSTPEQITKAVANFFMSLNPLMPSIESIEQAIQYQKLKDSADNEIDKVIYTALHTITSLDCTPLVNLTHFIYDGVIRDDAIDELMDKFGTFDNMMKEYIVSDKEFANDLKNVADFLKRNANTDHTQFLTAYLTPAQITEIFGNEVDYSAGYDIRNIDTNIMVRGVKDEEFSYFRGRDVFELKEISGLSVLPAGANLQNIEGREVLDTVSLGYGQGKQTVIDKDGNEVTNPRVIDTSTWVSYSKDQLKMFSNEFRTRHTTQQEYVNYDYIETYLGTIKVISDWGYNDIVDPKYARFKCWIDLVDDMSGFEFTNPVKAYETIIPSINNRVIATISDMIFPNIKTGGGDDDVILNDIQRIYNDGSDSVVRARADGGDGMDIIDISALKEYNEQMFNFNYSVNNNNLRFLRNVGDAADYDLSFSNFEEIRIGKAHNKINVMSGTDIQLGEGQEPEEIRILDTTGGGNLNEIYFNNIKGKSLYFQGVAGDTNKVNGTANNDVLVVAKIEGEPVNGVSHFYGMDGNDMIKGGDIDLQIGQYVTYDSNRTKLQTVEDMARNILCGGNGTDYIQAAGDSNILYGENGRDLLQGSDKVGIHVLNGGLDNDTVMAGKFDAELNGDEGNDAIKGDIGRDILNGGIGNDFITGGDGADNFVFSTDFGKDIIQDYKSDDKLIFDNTSGISNVEQLQFVKNQEQGYLALIYDTNCIKLNQWSDDVNLNITIGGNVVDASVVNNLIQNATSFSSYADGYLIPNQPIDTSIPPEIIGEEPVEPGTSDPLTPPPADAPIIEETTIPYSTQNQYTPVFTGSETNYNNVPLYDTGYGDVTGDTFIRT